MKRVCMFCMRSHRGTKPAICRAKGEVMRAYLNAVPGIQFWQIMLGIEQGVLDLEKDARALLLTKQHRRRTRS